MVTTTVISIVACCHSVKLFALAAQAFRCNNDTTHSGSVYFASWGKTCWDYFAFIWTQLMKWSSDKYNTQRQLVGV